MVTETSLHRSVAWIAFCSSMSGRTAYHGGGKCELTGLEMKTKIMQSALFRSIFAIVFVAAKQEYVTTLLGRLKIYIVTWDTNSYTSVSQELMHSAVVLLR